MPPFRTVTHEKPKFNTYFSNTLHTNFLHLRAVGSTHFLQTDFNPLVTLLHLHPRAPRRAGDGRAADRQRQGLPARRASQARAHRRAG